MDLALFVKIHKLMNFYKKVKQKNVYGYRNYEKYKISVLYILKIMPARPKKNSIDMGCDL